MLHWLRRSWATTPETRANRLAGLIACGALGLLYLEAPPLPAGSGTPRLNQVRSRAVVLAGTGTRATEAAPAAAMASIATTPHNSAAINTTAAAEAGSSDADPVIARLKQKVALLEQGRQFLKECPDYTAVFSKQELVGNQLLDLQDIYLKCRHQPFSLYLLWLSGDEGREVLYVDGENDGRMIVHGGGWKARLPALTISPESSLAMQESRYPVTKAGLLGTIDITLDVHAEDLAKGRLKNCTQLEDQEFDGRLCTAFLTEYKDAQISPTYRKSLVLIDKEWNVPLYMRNFGWPNAGDSSTGEELDEATLIEFYTFTEIEFRQQLATSDFDRNNEEYLFK